MVFALDSIPAIFGLTTDTYIVFTANAFALMGCVSSSSSWAGCSTGSSTSTSGSPSCLPFIGAKLVVEALEGSHVDHVGALVLPHIGIVFSLCFIAATLAVTTVTGLVRGRSGPTVA